MKITITPTEPVPKQADPDTLHTGVMAMDRNILKVVSSNNLCVEAKGGVSRDRAIHEALLLAFNQNRTVQLTFNGRVAIINIRQIIQSVGFTP